jgi:hypothetical protein
LISVPTSARQARARWARFANSSRQRALVVDVADAAVDGGGVHVVVFVCFVILLLTMLMSFLYDVASGGVVDRVVYVVVAVGLVDDVDVIADVIGVFGLVYGWCAKGSNAAPWRGAPIGSAKHVEVTRRESSLYDAGVCGVILVCWLVQLLSSL